MATKAQVYSDEFLARHNPDKRTPELATEILMRVANGEAYASIWRSDHDKFPHPVNWSYWLTADAELSLAWAQAKNIQADTFVHDAMVIADTEPDRIVSDNGSRYDNAHVTWLKNRADIRMKRAAQINPIAYGDKQLHAGHDGGALKTEVALSLPQLAERLRLAARPSDSTIEGKATPAIAKPQVPLDPVPRTRARDIEPDVSEFV